MVRFLLSATVIASLLVVGCNGPKANSTTQDPKTNPTSIPEPKDALKKLEIVDVKKGAPTKYQKNLQPVKAGDKVWVYYTGTYKDGKEFDSNDPKTHPDKFPLSFVVGSGSVIRGWDEGVVGMLPGGKRKLSVPYSLAYGEAGRGDIPPKSDLYFVVELIDVVKDGDGMFVDFYDEKVGSGTPATKGKTVTVHFEITTTGGLEVENSRKENKPETFKLGAEEVHEGFEQGLLNMRPGGVRYFRLPPLVGFRVMPTEGAEPPELVTYVKAEMISVK